MYTKEKILLSCFDEDIIFEDILQKLIAYDDNVKFEEIADTMDNTEHIKLCDRLLKYTTNCIQLLNLGGNNHSDDTNKDMTDENENVIRDLQTVSDFIMLYAVLPKYRPYSLTATIQCLHDILILLVTEESSADNTKTSDNKHNSIVAITSLRSSISRICEYWWTHKEVGAENFITQLVPHLLVTALKPTAHESDVKRLHKVSGALLLLDFEDESIESIRSLLLRCTESVLFLKSSEGRRFLAFLFSVHIGTNSILLLLDYCFIVD